MSTKTTRGRRSKAHKRPSAATAAIATPQGARRSNPKQSPRRPAPRRPARRRHGGGRSWGAIVLLGVVGLGLLLLFFGGRSSQPKGGAVAARPAPPFRLASTAGGSVSLSEYAGKNVLLYFSEGVGCDACFYQMVDLEQNAKKLSGAGITVLPIVMNPVDQTLGEVQRFGLMTPFLIDSDGAVSNAYDTLGTGMHANLPGHAFVFIDGSGSLRWEKEYPSMYVSSGDLLNALSPYLT